MKLIENELAYKVNKTILAVFLQDFISLSVS